MYTIAEKLIPINEYTRPGKKITVKGLIIHWTANTGVGANAEGHYKYFSNSTRYASAHYFVDDHSILRIIPENEMAYHVGAQTYKTTQFGSYPNNCLIGVEMCVNSDGNFAETYKRSVWLCADILKRYGLNVDQHLRRHYDITGKDCPRYFVFDDAGQKYMGMSAASAWEKFKADVKAAMAAPKSNPAPAPKPIGVKPTPVPTPTKEDDDMSKYFKDVPNDAFFAEAADKMKELGLMNGDTNGNFNPKGTLTRAEMAVITYRLLKSLGKV